MATCANCGGYLEERHRCRWWRVRLAFLFDLLIAGLATGVLAGLVFYWRDGQVSWTAIFLTALVGGTIRWSVIVGEPRRTTPSARP